MKRGRGILLGIVCVGEACAGLVAAWVLAPYIFNTAKYRVEGLGSRPWLHLLPVVMVAAVMAACVWVVLRAGGERPWREVAISWCALAANIVPVARVFSGAGPTFIDPVVLSLSAGAALWICFERRRRGEHSEIAAKREWLPVVALGVVTIVAGVWFYAVQVGFVSKLVYGYTDAGLYYLRVKNTALGRGFLQETASRPPFYDHFGPGLLFLVPFYWVVRSYVLVLWAQAAGLAALGPAVYVYARGRGVAGWGAFFFALAALLHPSISQMNYSFSYGFHPVTLAMPVVVLSIHYWEKERWWAFAATGLLAASFEETLFPLYVGVGVVTFAVGAWRRVRRGALSGAVLAAVSVGVFLLITRVVMPGIAGGEYFQFAKYGHLGEGVGEILLSPFLKGGAFWGLLFSWRSVFFVVLLLAPMGFLPLVSGRRLLYPAVVLLFVLLLENEDVKSISFWYQALVVAAWFPAMVAGGRKVREWWGGGRGTAAGVAVATAALFMSHFYGVLPVSRKTMAFQRERSEAFLAEVRELSAYARRAGRGTRVLATMRTATLFLDAGSVVPLQDWQGGADYDIVVLDATDRWGGQSVELMTKVRDAMLGSGEFRLERFGNVVVMERERP